MIERCVFVSLVTITWGSPSPTRTSCRWIDGVLRGQTDLVFFGPGRPGWLPTQVYPASREARTLRICDRQLGSSERGCCGS